MATAVALAARVRGVFSGLEFTHAELNERGEDHQVLVLDDRYLFRFPRHAHHPTGLALERAVIGAVRGRCDLPMPDYRFVAPGGEFAGYEMIQGVELTPERFAALARPAQERVLEQAAGFLSALHQISLDELAAESRARRLPFIAAALPALVPAVEGLYGRFSAMTEGPLRLTHGDMTSDHMLLAPEGDRLAGVIDFGDAEIGDAAYDVAYFWSYGAWAPAFVVDRYALKDQDPGLLERSRWHFARYRISRLGEALENGWSGVAGEIAGALPALLAGLLV